MALARSEKLFEESILEISSNQVAARVATIYAESLIEMAARSNTIDAVGDELASLIDDLFSACPDLEKMLSNPAVHRRKKDALLRIVLRGTCSTLIEDFLLLLCRHDRLDLVRLIAMTYQEMRDRKARRIRILVETAVPLEPSQKEQIRAMLQDKLQQDPVLINRIRPELLGGLLIHVGDKVYDSTVRYRLDSLRTQFLSRGSHEIQTRRDSFGSN